nr:uncharacterized protein LOC115265012 [Aedes albopictus]
MMKGEADADREANVLRRNKDHLWEEIELLINLAESAKEGEQLELLGVWSERLEEIAKDYRRTVCLLEATYGDQHRDDRMKFDTKYYALRAFYTKRLKQATQPTTTSTPSVKPVSHIRFPEIHLPRFSGKLTDWCVFRDAFESAIGNREEISNVDKFQYLKGLVQGEAARIIESISISELGYTDAWRALKLRYENKRQQIRCHIKSLFEIPSMRKESPEELLNLVDRFEQHLAVLKRLGEDTDSWDSLLICQLSVRLDPCTLKEWEGYCARLDCDNVANVLGGASSEDAEEEDMPTYVAMVNFLQNYARVLQSIGPVPGPTRDRDTKAKSSKFSAHVSSTSAPSGSDSSKKCEKCNQLHFLYHCPEFQKLPEQQRFEFVKSKKLCANCLRSTDHFAKSCPAKQCNRCAKKHHTLLHGAQFVQPPPPGSQSSSSASLVAQPVDSKPAPPTPSPVMNVPAQSLQHQSQPQRLYPVVGSHPQQCSTVPTVPANRHYAMMACDKENEPTAVILPTALVEIEDARGRKLTARCLLDSGSQSHFITKALCDRLQLPRIRATAPVLVCGIGQTTTMVTDSVTAKVSSRVSPYVVEPQLLVLPSLAIKLSGAMINTREWQIPATVRLADPTFHVSNDVDNFYHYMHAQPLCNDQ